MKEGWEYKTFKDQFSINMGKTPPRGDSSSWDKSKITTNKWVSIADISLNEGKIIFDTKEYISDKAAEKIKKVKAGSLLMSFKLTIGKMAFAGDDLFTNEAIIAIPQNEDYDLHFLYYYLLQYDWRTLTEGNEKVKGATLNKQSIGKILLPIIPIDEQRRIVSYLDSSFKLIDEIKNKALKSLTEAKALFQSALAEAMEPKEGWEEKTLGEICFIARGGSPRPIKNFLTEDESGIPWIKIGDTEIGGKFINCTKEKIKKEGIKSSRFVRKGDFLLSNSMSFGRPYILKTDGCIHDGWLVLQNFKDTFIDDFLYYLLSCNYVQKQFDEYAYGSTVRNLKTDSVSRVSVNYPPLPTQKLIVSHLDKLSSKVRAIEEKYQKMVEECDALKQAMLRDVFE